MKLVKDPKSLIASRFLLKAKLENPSRMSLVAINMYWNHWVDKSRKGDPFSFLNGNERQQGDGDQDEEDQDDEDQDQENQDQEGQNQEEDQDQGDQNKEDQDQEDQDDEDQGGAGMGGLVPDFAIDEGLLSPIMCGETSTERILCLQALVTGRSQDSEVFRTTVQLVDTLEVSCIKCRIFPLSYRILG